MDDQRPKPDGHWPVTTLGLLSLSAYPLAGWGVTDAGWIVWGMVMGCVGTVQVLLSLGGSQ